MHVFGWKNKKCRGELHSPKLLMKTRRSIRLKGYDYAQEGVYFITICTFDKQWLFGNVVDGVMKLNELGQAVYDEWQHTTTVRPNVILHGFVVMPNHIHGIIEITSRGELHSPIKDGQQNKIENGGLKGECNSNKNKEGELHSPLRSPSQTIGSIVRGYKSAVTKWARENTGCDKIWQRNYYEHIIRNYISFLKISDYIQDNPNNWEQDKFNS